jgi:hypothetical protein
MFAQGRSLHGGQLLRRDDADWIRGLPASKEHGRTSHQNRKDPICFARICIVLET